MNKKIGPIIIAITLCVAMIIISNIIVGTIFISVCSAIAISGYAYNKRVVQKQGLNSKKKIDAYRETKTIKPGTDRKEHQVNEKREETDVEPIIEEVFIPTKEQINIQVADIGVGDITPEKDLTPLFKEIDSNQEEEPNEENIFQKVKEDDKVVKEYCESDYSYEELPDLNDTMFTLLDKDEILKISSIDLPDEEKVLFIRELSNLDSGKRRKLLDKMNSFEKTSELIRNIYKNYKSLQEYLKSDKNYTDFSILENLEFTFLNREELGKIDMINLNHREKEVFVSELLSLPYKKRTKLLEMMTS